MKSMTARMTLEKTTCAACRYWEPVPDEDGQKLGTCRRFPPSYDGWAMTTAGDWCGEFSAKAEPKPG